MSITHVQLLLYMYHCLVLNDDPIIHDGFTQSDWLNRIKTNCCFFQNALVVHDLQ